LRANGDVSIGQSQTNVGWISFGSTKCEYAWSTSCAQVLSAPVSTPAASSFARSSSGSRDHAPSLSSASTKRRRSHGGSSSTSCPRNVTFVPRIAASAARETSVSVRSIVSR
jgi:hypothetical protein